MRRETYSGARQQVGGRFHKSLKQDERENLPKEYNTLQHVRLKMPVQAVHMYLVKLPTCLWQR
jgi:hypothetical protein